APEPIMLPLDALEIPLVSFKLSFKVVAAVIDGVPVHVLTVKGLPGAIAALRLFRAEKQTALVLPIGQLPAVPNAQRLQLVANDLNSLINKVHCNPPWRKSLRI